MNERTFEDGSPIVLDEAACLRLSIAESYEVPSPIWCPPYFSPSERVIDKMWYDTTHGWPAPSFHVRTVMLGGMRRDNAMQDWRKWYFYGKLKRRTGWRDDRRRYRRRTGWRMLIANR